MGMTKKWDSHLSAAKVGTGWAKNSNDAYFLWYPLSLIELSDAVITNIS
jgi:hypothetical protein